MRLADYVVQFLKEKKINTVFTVSGGGSIFLCDALYKAKNMLLAIMNRQWHMQQKVMQEQKINLAQQ